jgi:uncharacterized protein YndB with AHSA1/START domain
MTSTAATINVDQFIPRSPGRVWEALTTPEQLARWWVPGDIAPVVGHRFLLEMPGWGNVPCEVLEAVEPERLVYRFGEWTLTWRLVAEGGGTRLLLEHSGFDLERPDHRFAFDHMGPGWRDEVVPRLVALLGAGD